MSSDHDTPTKAELETRINELEQQLNQQPAQPKSSRRTFLGALAGMAGAGAMGAYGMDQAAADPSDASGTVYFEQIGDQDNPVSEMYVDTETTYTQNEEFDSITVNNSADLAAVSTGRDNINRYTSDNGTDGAAIQQTLDAASAGETVVIDSIDNPPYKIGSPIEVDDRTRLLIAEDIEVTGDHDSLSVYSTAAGSQIIGAGGAIISDGAGKSGIVRVAGDHSRVENIRMDNPGGGVRVSGNGVVVNGADVKDVTGNGIQVYTGAENVVVANSSVRDTSEVHENYCFYVTGGSVNARFVNNTAIGGANSKQAFAHDYDGTDGTKIVNNVARGNFEQRAINIETAKDVTVSDNTITADCGRSIYVSNISDSVVSDNTVRDGGGRVEIRISDDIRVEGNRLTGTKIQLQGDTRTGCVKNHITDGPVGIQYDGSQYAEIRDNKIYDCNGAAIFQDTASSQDTENISIIGNRAADLGAGTQTYGWDPGTNEDFTPGMYVVDNDFRGNTTAGINDSGYSYEYTRRGNRGCGESVVGTTDSNGVVTVNFDGNFGTREPDVQTTLKGEGETYVAYNRAGNDKIESVDVFVRNSDGSAAGSGIEVVATVGHGI